MSLISTTSQIMAEVKCQSEKTSVHGGHFFGGEGGGGLDGIKEGFFLTSNIGPKRHHVTRSPLDETPKIAWKG